MSSNATSTSKAAAFNILPSTGSQRRRILDYLTGTPATDEEIIAALVMNSSSVRPRRGELVDGGWVIPSGETRQTVSGSDAIVWTVTAAGRAALAAGRDITPTSTDLGQGWVGTLFPDQAGQLDDDM